MADEKIVRTPVPSPTKGGVKRPKVVTGKMNETKHRIAKKAVGAGGFGFQRQGGMMLDFSQDASTYQSGYQLEAYRTSYAYGLGSRSGTYDVPRYFVQMNEQNGGILYWPTTLKEKYSWYRYWARCFTSPNVMVTREDGTEEPLYSLKAGDRVINSKGKVTEIDEVTTQQYEGEVVRLDVEANRWNDIEVTPEHPFLVLRSSCISRHHRRIRDEQGIEHRKTFVDIDYSPAWVEAADIQEGDCLIVPKTERAETPSMSVERARLLGYYMAEGNVNFDREGRPKAVTWSLGTHERDLLDEIKALCVAELGSEPSEYNYPERESATALRMWDREFAGWVYKNCGTGSRSKKLSDLVFRADDESVKHIIGCWLNGDGNRDNAGADGQVDGTTCSQDMAHQLFLMMVRVGLAPAKREKTVFACDDRSRETGPGWRIFLPPMYANYISEYFKWDKAEKHHRHRKYNHEGNMLLPVRGISRRHHNGLIWNLSTRGESYDDRTFLVYGMVTHNTDPYIGRALELLADLPMSKLTLTMPKATGKLKKKKRDEILRFFKYQMEVIGGFETCQSILWEWNMIGNVYMFHEWDEKRKLWSRAVMLPPEEVGVFEYPFQQNKRVEYRPERLIKLIADGMPQRASGMPDGNECDRSDMQAKILEGIPKELVEMVRREGCIVMDSDPMTGSFVHHIARRKSPYQDLGASVLERVLIPMLQKEHYKYTQLSLASRNMTPKNLVTAPGLLQEEVDDLRTQVDLSYLDPEYTIVTNYEVTWEQIGAQDRLLSLDGEYERIDQQIFAGLGVTRELLTGESNFSGSKVTIDILNTMFLLTREVLQSYIEKSLFIPVCEAHGWYEEDENGIKTYWYPKVGFNRLTIRDNAEVFDSLFQLYQKGSIPVDIIYELFNLNSDDIDAKLLEDLFTVKDANFNRIIEEISGETGRAIVENTDIVERVAKYLELTYQEPAGEGEGEDGDFGGFGDFGGGGEEEQPAPEQPTDDFGGGEEETALDESEVDALVDTIVEGLPEGAGDEEIQEVVETL